MPNQFMSDAEIPDTQGGWSANELQRPVAQATHRARVVYRPYSEVMDEAEDRQLLRQRKIKLIATQVMIALILASVVFALYQLS